MASERKPGLGNLPAGLLRSTTPPETIPPEPAEDQGRGGESVRVDSAESRTPAPKSRRKRAPVGGETKGRKLSLPDDVHDRLWLLARQRRTTVSAVAADILDRALPRFKVEREG
jgi:hypothetical protein